MLKNQGFLIIAVRLYLHNIQTWVKHILFFHSFRPSLFIPSCIHTTKLAISLLSFLCLSDFMMKGWEAWFDEYYIFRRPATGNPAISCNF